MRWEREGVDPLRSRVNERSFASSARNVDTLRFMADMRLLYAIGAINTVDTISFRHFVLAVDNGLS